MNNLISSICKVTTTPESTLQNILKTGNYCITSDVVNMYFSDNSMCEFDLLWGILQVHKEDDNTLKYVFKPSKNLEEMIRNSILNKEDPLIKALEDKINTKMLSTYKELL